MTTFEVLSARRRAYVEAARDNGFEEGLRKLLADLYPDNAHFIYELLQNAEDAGAREVIFDLKADGLQVKHDGPRLFDLRDIESITGIGQSTKADEATSIGKFGVGFKAVFAYTQAPVIHSGEHSFAIHDLFVPVQVATGAQKGWTTFWFPFDRAEKPASRASQEVAIALREISQTTLLFLNNIHLIACSLPDGDERLLERRALDKHVVEIESAQEDGGPSYWYRIAGDVIVDGVSYPAAAAFALEAHASKQKESKNYSVQPVEGQVFIYFPAVKESSGLKFHVHAPFASTVARDSVRDDPGNDALVEGVAELITATLPQMRDAGLITDGLLRTLPNDNDELPKRYAALRDRVTAAFGAESFTPMAGGGHAPSSSLLRSDRAVRSALSVDDVNFLRGLEADIANDLAIGWLPVREGRGRAFLDSLDALDFAQEELSAAFEVAGTAYTETAALDDDDEVYEVDDEVREELEAWNAWISQKDAAWLREFYAMLEGLAPKSRTYNYRLDLAGSEFLSSLAAAPLLRIQDGDGVRHVPGNEAYLPTAPGLHAQQLVIDSLAVFEDTDDSGDKETRHTLRNFYEHAQVKRWDAAAQLDARFKTYAQDPASVTERHLADLVTLKRLLDDKAVAPSTYMAARIFVAVRSDGSRFWATPRETYLDEPFISTGLESLYTAAEYVGNRPGQLAPEYFDTSSDVTALAQALGSITGLVIDRVPIWNNPRFEKSWRYNTRENQNMVARDWRIPHLGTVLSTGDETLLRSLWKVIAAAEETCAEAVYRANASSRVYRVPSQLLQSLTTQPWILDSDGNLSRPQDMTIADLAQGLVMPANAPLMDHLGFGRKATLEAMRKRGDEARAKDLGLESVAVLHEIVEAYNEDPDAFRQWRAARGTAALPDAPSAAPEQRAKRAGDLAAGAPVRNFETRVRSVYVQVPGHRSSAKGYLTQLYSNDDGIMFCQICTSPMPFKVSGDYYFEAVQFVTNATHDLRENRLALCPTCAAKYRHAGGTSPEDLRDDLLTQGVEHQGSITVDVILADEAAQIRFVGKHAIDLQAALSATESERIDADDFSEFEVAEL
jgi:hypothetical protein